MVCRLEDHFPGVCMPYKHNADRHHHIEKMKHQMTNCPKYEARLRSWMSAATDHAERPASLFGARHRNDADAGCGVPNETAPQGRYGKFGNRLIGLTVVILDHTMLSRRARRRPALSHPLPDDPLHVLVDSTGVKVFGACQGLQEKHGERSLRHYRKLHLAAAVDGGLSMVVPPTAEHRTPEVGPLSGEDRVSDGERGLLRATLSPCTDARGLASTIVWLPMDCICRFPVVIS